jgi:DNA-binding LacI/PurR family transcriptional regulator
LTTIRDVAKRAGVSISTVSRTVNGGVFVEEGTRDKVRNAIEELGYQPNYLAKGLKVGKTNAICLLIPSIRNYSINILARGVEDASRKNGFTLILCNTDEDKEIEQIYIEKMLSNWVDGIVYCTATRHSDVLEFLDKNNYPVVLALREYTEKFDTFCVDNFKGGYIATQYLIEKGFKRIGILSGRLDLDLYSDRLKGYQKALDDYGIPFRESYVISAKECEKVNIRFTPKIDKVMNGKEEPDSFFATGDLIAVNAINELRKIGLSVPKDIPIIGFDDIDISPMTYPALTTVSQPLYEIGLKATERLIKRIRNVENVEPETVRFEPQIIIRDSA